MTPLNIHHPLITNGKYIRISSDDNQRSNGTHFLTYSRTQRFLQLKVGTKDRHYHIDIVLHKGGFII